jgi:hypothetical protein
VLVGAFVGTLHRSALYLLSLGLDHTTRRRR